MSSGSGCILEMKNISKSFPGVKALDNVDLHVEKGEVHAVMGENGAGKSTLMKVLFGLLHQDEGRIEFKGVHYTPKSPTHAIHTGISMIPQEISPVPYLDIASNIFLGREPCIAKHFIKQEEMYEKADALLQEYGLTVSSRTLMKDVSIAQAQLIAIATAVSYNSDLVIMDEPTSALTEQEVDTLFTVIRKIHKVNGISVIYISHKLDEVFQIANKITVLRDGKLIKTDTAENYTKESMIAAMVGRSMDEFFAKKPANIGKELLSVKNLTRDGVFHDVSFSLNRGEVLGFGGLMGAGRTEVMDALFGFHPADSGEIFVDGKKLKIHSPQDAIAAGMGYVTEDRKLTGLFPTLNVQDNMIISDVDSYLNILRLLDAAKIRTNCEKQRKSLSIKTPSLKQIIDNLSGGNQQKVLLARWLLMEPDILILDEPTRGIDVGAKAEIHRIISELAAMGKAIIMVSSEMPELLSMSDRIVVMHEGKYSGELDRSEATQNRVLELAIGEGSQKGRKG